MENTEDKILYKTKQHKIILITNFLKTFIVFGLPVFLLLYLVTDFGKVVNVIIVLVLLGLAFGYAYFFWIKSFFIVTNRKIGLEVRNGVFSNYSTGIYFRNIKDIAYSKNNVLHYLFNYGTFFARSSAGANGDFMVNSIPKIKTVYDNVNKVYLISEENRDKLVSLESMNDLSTQSREKESFEEIVEKEKGVLLGIQGVGEVEVLDDKDRVFIFENEEDRNHGVYECLRKKVLFVLTHDSSFREPDEHIVLKKGEKVIFPTVKFHEIKRSGVLSSSPGLEAHKYLEKKFKKITETDATILVGFDI